MHTSFWLWNLRERDQWENLDVEMIIILKWILKLSFETTWNGLTSFEDRDKPYPVIKLWIPWYLGGVLTSWRTDTFSAGTPLRGLSAFNDAGSKSGYMESNDLMKVKNDGGRTWKVRSWVVQGCTDVGLQFNMATKFLIMASNICGISVSSFLHVTMLAFRILSWLLNFLKNPCTPRLGFLH